jgi:hypothetical protein
MTINLTHNEYDTKLQTLLKSLWHCGATSLSKGGKGLLGVIGQGLNFLSPLLRGMSSADDRGIRFSIMSKEDSQKILYISTLIGRVLIYKIYHVLLKLSIG